MTAHRPPRAAFTIIELLVVIGIIGFLIAITMPALCRSREGGNRVKCASNLRQIGLAMQAYADDNKGRLPRARFDGSGQPIPTAFTGATASSAFGPDGPAANDVSAAIYLVMRTQDLTPEVFVCPSSSAERSAAAVGTASNFASADVLSYSYTNPYAPQAVTGGPDGYAFRNLNADFALAADVNPGMSPGTGTQQDNVNPAAGPDAKRAEMQKANTNNHNGDGQNVLYGDGHVEFQSTPFCGAARATGSGKMRDNIYVAGGHGTPAPAAVFASPVDALDSVCLPTDDDATTAPSPLTEAMNTREFGARRIVWLTAGAVLLGSCGAGGLAIRTSKRHRRLAKLAAPTAVASNGRRTRLPRR